MSDRNGCPVRYLTSSLETKYVQWIWRMRMRHQLFNASIFGTVPRNRTRISEECKHCIAGACFKSVMEDLQIFRSPPQKCERRQTNRGGSTLGQGARVPQIHLLPPPQIQKLADVISKVPKCSKIYIFWGSAPDPAGEAYSAPPDPLADGEGLAINDRFQM